MRLTIGLFPILGHNKRLAMQPVQQVTEGQLAESPLGLAVATVFVRAAIAGNTNSTKSSIVDWRTL